MVLVYNRDISTIAQELYMLLFFKKILKQLAKDWLPQASYSPLIGSSMISYSKGLKNLFSLFNTATTDMLLANEEL